MYKLLAGTGVQFTSSEPGLFGGHRGRKIFGRLDCRAALRAVSNGGYAKSRVFFAHEADARALGYRPCAVCLPEAYREWKELGERGVTLAETSVSRDVGPLPRPPKYVSYLRVSTARQGASGLGLEAQRTAVAGFIAMRKGLLAQEVIEIESGRRKDRPRLAEALRVARLHGATLVIAKLDRLARNVAFISGLMESGVDFVAVDFPQATPFTIHILSAMAEFEAAQISKRTKDALAAAKARGVRLGGNQHVFSRVQPLGSVASARVRKIRADARSVDLSPTIQELINAGLSLRKVARELSMRGIATPRGLDLWSAGQVARVLARLPKS